MIAPNISTQPENFATTEILAENQPASDNRDTGFQAENQGGYSWVHIFLTDDLQGVGNATGHNSGIETGIFAGENSGKIRTFKDQRRDSGEDSTDQKLDTGHFTPSTSGEKWSIVRICKENRKAQISTRSSPLPMANPSPGVRQRR